MLNRFTSLLLISAICLSAVAVRSATQLPGETSAFLRTQTDSPVDWMPWGEAAFGRARSEQKAVFLFIGTFASELSRATARQTFANADTAALLNQNFICVLVDRDEHPELGALYQTYLSEVKQVTGQPMNLWLTPELRPYEGAAYLPPTEEWGKSSFLKVAQQARDAWANDAKGCRARAQEAVAQLAPVAPAVAAAGGKTKLAAAAEAWRPRYDAAHGGFSEPPKNPEPELLRFLLRQPGADHASAVATLRAIATGAMHDPLDGGFFHYATDAEWRLPYQQKFLADQARLALAFLDAAPTDDKKLFTGAARGALDFALSRLAQPDGTFSAVEDATLEAFAGYYVWTAAEIDEALGADAGAFKGDHGVEATGNISADADPSGRLQGKNFLRFAVRDEPGSAAAAGRLLTLRDRRPAPPRDDRASAAAHGLLLAAFARAGTELAEPRYLKAAEQLFGVIKQKFIAGKDGDLRHLRGSTVPAGPADYNALALGCREFARAAHHKEADALATRLLATSVGRFFDPAGGRYFATPAELPPGIFVRPPAMGDAPSTEALALMAGVPPELAKAISAGLWPALDDANTPAPGDTLLALALLP